MLTPALKVLVLAAILTGALSSIVAGNGAAHAAEPNNQGCLGADFSTYARYGSTLFDSGAGFGQFNAALAQRVPGLGFPIQLHLAGLVPDGLIANSCND